LSSVGRSVLTLFLCNVAILGFSQTSSKTLNSEQRTARYMDSIRNNPELLLPFLREMPKGADLHNHLSGGIYAESYIDWAASDGLCVDRTTSALIAPPCDSSCDRFTSKPPLACAYQDHVLYNQIVDAWSMRNWVPSSESGHDHFFASFDKFQLVAHLHTGDMLAEAASHAADDHLQYVELMHTADGSSAGDLGNKVGWNDNLRQLREALLAGGLKDVVVSTRKKLDADESKMRSDLRCGTSDASPGCAVTVRYLYQVLRGLPREQVFAQMVLGFELAQADSRFVGLNLVMPEDWYVPMHDFDLHMHMLDYLHEVYPKVHITLHADELAPGMVRPEGLRFHIRESIERGHAERIGHGVAVMSENDPIQLLQEMSKRNILVEICLTSNDVILGVSGDHHPFPVYRRYGVPVTLATDDEGVSRSDMTNEYLRAAESYGLAYVDLKVLARQSLEHAFLPGASLWSDAKKFRAVSVCARDEAMRASVSSACRRFLDGNERAREQWKLESEFARFEGRL